MALVPRLTQVQTRSVSTYPATISGTDGTLKLSGSSGTITLPTAVNATGKKYKLIHDGTSLTQVYTIATTSSQTIGGVAGGSYKLFTTGEVLEVESDGANWLISNHEARTGNISAGLATDKMSTTGGTFTKPTTMEKNTCEWQRQGKNMILTFNYAAAAATGTSASAGDFLWTLPGSQSIDSSVDFVTTLSANIQDHTLAKATMPIVGMYVNLNTNRGEINTAIAYDSTRFRVGATQAFTQFGVISTTLFTFGNANTGVKFTVTIPIAEWQP